ncbi:DnaJ domain-containing protein [Dichotomocladium elegans]|nr:DnaJ domain-containing protein [Dichotomocladium elegans]
MHTSEQVDIVKSILECGTDYYKVLSLKRNCTDIQIKKAYRKLALQLHPDKNSAPGADEAFKLISKSFAVLSDPQKRAIHDANGGDPEQRGSASSWCSVHRYEDDISPEDLFNMFFGPAGTAVTDGSGFCSATFVGPGFTPHTYYRSSSGSAGHSAPSHHHQHHHNHQEWIRSSASKTSVASSRSSGAIAILFQILPLVILFGYSLFSGLFADYSATATSSSSPAFSLKPTPLFTQARVTQRYQVPYYVNPSAFRPMEGNQFCLSRVEQQVEIDWMRSLQNACQHERRERATRMNAASGTIFGIGRNEEQYQAALKMPLTSCEQARQYGYVYR